MLDLGSLVGFLELDDTKWNKGIDNALRDVDDFGRTAKPRAEAAGKKAGDALGDGLYRGADGKIRNSSGKFASAGEKAAAGLEEGATPAARRAGEKAGDSFGEGIKDKAKKGAVVAAAAFGAAFYEALDVDAGRDKLAAQLDANTRQAARYGRAASDLYSGAWGESMDEVNTAVASVVTSIEGMDRAGEERLEGLTAKALDFAAAFDVDVARAIQVAGTMVDSGLAKNADRAFDLLFKGSSKVPLALREDLVDAVEEYGQFFELLGYSGPEAFAMLVDASDKGIYGIDKAGDAVKEFTIRATDMSEATSDAYKLIGLDAEEMTEKILAGGDDAQDATQKIIRGLLNIESPSKRANAAIALFGTPLEDLNVRDIPEFLRNMKATSRSMEGTAGAAERMGTTLNDNAQTKVKEFGRTLKMDVVDFLANDAIPFIESDVIPTLKGIGDALDNMPGWAVKGTVGGVLGLIAAGKVGSLLGDIGKLRGGLGGGGLGKASKFGGAVPVWVVNDGLGGGLGGGGKKGKGWTKAVGVAGPVGAGAALALSLDDDQREHLAGQTTGAAGIGGGDIGGLAAEAAAFDDLTEKAGKTSDAIDDASGSADAFRTEIFGLQPEIKGLGVRMDDTKGKTSNLTQMLLKVPDPNITYETPGLLAALDGTRILLDRLQYLDGRQARAYVAVEYSQAGYQNIGGLQEKHVGGQVLADVPYLVGREGAEELFVPDTAGRIFTRGQVAAGMGVAGSGHHRERMAAAGAGGQTVRVEFPSVMRLRVGDREFDAYVDDRADSRVAAHRTYADATGPRRRQ